MDRVIEKGVEGTTITNCGSAGINLLAGSILTFDSGTIEDVEYGAWVYSDGFLYIENGSTVQNTDVGIYVFPGGPGIFATFAKSYS